MFTGTGIELSVLGLALVVSGEQYPQVTNPLDLVPFLGSLGHKPSVQV
jgi:hypothetical protein